MKEFLNRYFTEVAHMARELIDFILIGMLAGVCAFSAFYVFVALYGFTR